MCLVSDEMVAEPTSTQQWPQKKIQNPVSSSMDLFQNMLLFEQAEGDNSDDDDLEDDTKDNSGSLLRIMTSRVEKDLTPASDDQLLKCVSCTGLLPSGYNKQDEQSYCLPEVGGSTLENQEEAKKYQSICTGAVRVSTKYTRNN